MSASDKLDKSPNQFIVLDAISRGISSIDKISKASKMDKLEVELITNDLLTQRLIAKTERRGLIFRKNKQELGITDIGMKLLNAKKQELEQKRQQMQQSYNNRDGTQLQSYMDANRMWMPMMLFSGIMDIMFFTSMMSYMGLGINPLENAIMGVQTSGGGSLEQTANSSNDADHHSSNDEHGTSGETDGTGEGADYDNSSFDSGGFDGFEGGGFDSF